MTEPKRLSAERLAFIQRTHRPHSSVAELLGHIAALEAQLAWTEGMLEAEQRESQELARRAEAAEKRWAEQTVMRCNEHARAESAEAENASLRKQLTTEAYNHGITLAKLAAK